jgi:WD40 repeat protein
VYLVTRYVYLTPIPHLCYVHLTLRVDWSPRCPHLLASAGKDGACKVWDVRRAGRGVTGRCVIIYILLVDTVLLVYVCVITCK